MALQLGALRDELAGDESRLATTDTRLAVLMVMVGGLYALRIPGLWLLLRVSYKTGALG